MRAVRIAPDRFVPSYIDSTRDSVNTSAMDREDDLPKRADNPLRALVLQDLDPLSIDELHARIAALEAEIDRSRKKILQSVNHKASAEALFKK